MLIQFVTPGTPFCRGTVTVVSNVKISGGPSDGKLLTNDQILSVNGIDARCLQKEEVVNLVRETLNELHITVTQPTGKQVVALVEWDSGGTQTLFSATYAAASAVCVSVTK